MVIIFFDKESLYGKMTISYKSKGNGGMCETWTYVGVKFLRKREPCKGCSVEEDREKFLG